MKMLRRCLKQSAFLARVSLLQKDKFSARSSQLLLCHFLHQKSDNGEAFKNSALQTKSTNKETDSGGSKDLLVTQLQRATSLSSLLSVISQHVKIMNNEHLSLTFRMLYYSIKSENVSADTISKSHQFRGLCNETLRKIRHFSTNEIIDVLKTLCFLNIPEETALFQAICQMLRHTINDLNLKEILFLSFILFRNDFDSYKKPKTPLVESIKMALPLVLQTQMEYQLEPDNLTQLIDCFNVVMKCNLKSSASTLDRLSKLLLEKKGEWSGTQTINLFFPLAFNFQHHLSDPMSKLLNEILLRLADHLLDYNDKQTNIMLSVLSNNKNNVKLFHTKLLTAFSNKAVQEKWVLGRLCNLLKMYNFYEFVSTEVLDSVADIMLNNPNLVIEDPSTSVLTLIESFSMADYLPGSSNEFLKVILLAQNKIDTMKTKAPHLFVKLVAHLAILEVATVDLIREVFEDDFIQSTFEKIQRDFQKGEKHLLQNYRLLDQVARIEFPDYEGPYLPENLLARSIKDRSKVLQPLDISVKDFLEVGLGGSQFMLNDLWTRYGHYIDHLIVMRKGDFPVALNTKPTPALAYPESKNGLRYVEDVNVPADAKILAVLLARQEWFTKDPPRLSGWTSLQHRTLTKLGYNPVVLGPPIITEGRNQDLLGHLDNEIY